jgi:cytochrome c biogenesis protein ResB
VVCLFILVILVIWGTVYQVDHGLYQAQLKFFHSWFFLIFGFIPFPGTELTMFVLFINLICSLIFRITFKLSQLGNIILHIGIIVLLLGGFLTFYFSEESSLILKEGETTNTSSSHFLWEVAIWEQKKGDKDIYAIDTEDFTEGESILIKDLNLELHIIEHYKNCSPFINRSSTENQVINASGIEVLKGIPSSMKGSKNIEGVVFEINPYTGTKKTILLYGQDSLPTSVNIANHSYFFSLRKKK